MGGSYSKPREISSVYFPKFQSELPDLTGKVVAITGCTTGTGFIAAETCAKLGAEVLMLNRPSSRADNALKSITDKVPDAKVIPIPCDLGDFSSVKAAAKEIHTKYKEKGLDVLVNNAGIMATPDIASVDGFGLEMQTNHLSHFLLTKELFPLLEIAAEKRGESRIVNHSSEARKMPNTPLNGSHLEKNGGNLGGDESSFISTLTLSSPVWERYHQTKLANCVFTFALHDKLCARGSKVKALVAHPGLAATNLQVTSASTGGMNPGMAKALMYFAQSAEDGTMGLLQCAVGTDAESGQLRGPKGFTGLAVSLPPEPLLTDPIAKETLWKLSCEAIGSEWQL